MTVAGIPFCSTMYPARRSSWRQASRDQLHFVVAVLRDCLPRASCVSEPCSRGKSGPAIARVSDRLSLFVWLHVGVAGDDPELRFDSSGAGSLILGEEKIVGHRPRNDSGDLCEWRRIVVAR